MDSFYQENKSDLAIVNNEMTLAYLYENVEDFILTFFPPAEIIGMIQMPKKHMDQSDFCMEYIEANLVDRLHLLTDSFYCTLELAIYTNNTEISRQLNTILEPFYAPCGFVKWVDDRCTLIEVDVNNGRCENY